MIELIVKEVDKHKAFNIDTENGIRALDGIKAMISFIGGDSNNAELLDTPRRVLKYFSDACAGYSLDLESILSTTFESRSYENFVLLKNIEFRSTCEHHLLPILGHASIAYFPKDRVIGISKLARLVDAISLRLQLQERMTVEIGDALNKFLPNNGVAVFVSASHYCMKVAGVQKKGSVMDTTYFSGRFDDIKNQDRFLELITK